MTAKDLLSHDLPPEVWSLIQRGLAHAGFYRGTLLGRPGKKTAEALDAYLASQKKDGNAAALAEKLVELALGEVGVKEKPSNSGPRIIEYQRATWLDGTGWPYCAAFICWLIMKAIESGIKVPFERPLTAAAWDFDQKWVKEQKGKGVVLLTSGSIRRGDIVIFKISHIGLAVENESGGRVLTVEGNTSAEGGREGDGVWRKSRKKSEFRSWIRFTA